MGTNKKGTSKKEGIREEKIRKRKDEVRHISWLLSKECGWRGIHRVNQQTSGRGVRTSPLTGLMNSGNAGEVSRTNLKIYNDELDQVHW